MTTLTVYMMIFVVSIYSIYILYIIICYSYINFYNNKFNYIFNIFNIQLKNGNIKIRRKVKNNYIFTVSDEFRKYELLGNKSGLLMILGTTEKYFNLLGDTIYASRQKKLEKTLNYKVIIKDYERNNNPISINKEDMVKNLFLPLPIKKQNKTKYYFKKTKPHFSINNLTEREKEVRKLCLKILRERNKEIDINLYDYIDIIEFVKVFIDIFRKIDIVTENRINNYIKDKIHNIAELSKN